jgi:hypothetical protein
MQSWIPAETATASFGDKRLNQRLSGLLDRMSQQPAFKFPAACKGNAETQAAYRFVNNDKVDQHKVFRPHRDATIGHYLKWPFVWGRRWTIPVETCAIMGVIP